MFFCIKTFFFLNIDKNTNWFFVIFPAKQLNRKLSCGISNWAYAGKFITIATKIERVADLATNIAEDVIFAVDGSIVRHT